MGDIFENVLYKWLGICIFILMVLNIFFLCMVVIILDVVNVDWCFKGCCICLFLINVLKLGEVLSKFLYLYF